MQDIAVDVERLGQPGQDRRDDAADDDRIAAIGNDDHELVAAEAAHFGGPAEPIDHFSEAVADLDQ